MEKSTKVAIAISITIVIIFSFYLACLNHVSVNQVGIAYNSINGEVSEQERPGWYITPPTTSVAYLSILPIQVTIPSEAHIINSKIVRFKKEYYKEFIKDQGFEWGMSNNEESIFLGYAYSGKKYIWLEVVEQGENVPDSATAKKMQQ